jgi:hypothetical protein
VSRTTVIKAVNSEGAPRYRRAARPTSFIPFESWVGELLAATPDMPTTVLAERVGWTGSIRWFPRERGTTATTGAQACSG